MAKNIKFSLEIEGGNAALVDDTAGELARIISGVADTIRHNGAAECSYQVHDLNGNRVGAFFLEIEEPEIACPECGEEPTDKNPAGEWLCYHCGHAWEGGEA